MERGDEPLDIGSPSLVRWRWTALACAVWAVCLLGLFAGRQAPLGAFAGRLVAEDTGLPIHGAELCLAPGDPSLPGRKRRLLVDHEGRFRLRRLHAGEYEISADTESHHLPRTRINIVEGETTDVVLELAAKTPFLDLNVPQHVFVPGEPVQVTAHGFTRERTLSVQTYRLDAERVVREGRGSIWRTLLPSGAARTSPEERVPLASLPNLAPVSRMEVTPGRDNEGVFTQRVTLPAAEPGIYLVACRGDGIERLNWVLVTDLGLVAKSWRGQALAYAVDLATGRPAPGAEVSLYTGGQAQRIGQCDAQGLLDLPSLPAGDEKLLLARRGSSVAFLRVYAGGGGEEGQQHLFLYTDRPVYRPGHRVQFKGIARTLVGAEFRVPPSGPARVQVRDPRNTLVFAGDLNTNEFGSFCGDFTLSREAMTGPYTVTVDLAGKQHEESFSVAAYRKPEYTIDVRPERESYIQGEAGWVGIEARYFFGAPVVGAKVEYTILRSPRWSWEEDEEFAGYSEEPGEGEAVAFGQAETDSRGRCRVRFETTARPNDLEGAREDDDGLDPADQDYRYSIEATVTDAGRFSAAGSAKVNVWRGEYSLDVEPDRFVAAPGSPVSVVASARDRSGTARAGVLVEITCSRRIWDEEGFRAAAVGQRAATTDASGKATARFQVPRTGSYVVRAVARDPRGNRIGASAYVWASGEGDGDMPRGGPALQIVADRKEYRPGDTATFLLNAARAGHQRGAPEVPATALVTVEAEGVMERHLVPLTGPSTPFILPITQAHLPNFHLAVCFVHRKEFISGETAVSVSPKPRALQVEITADRQVYTPGEQALYTVRTRDADGRPVRAEVSLGVVDESIYAISEDRAEILRAFYPRRYNAVETLFSFPPVYLSGPDKSGGRESVRKEFPDTALWLPAIVTDANGEAKVPLKMPDTLTTWRATARAHTMDTLVGQGLSKVTCRKELMVRLLAPRFFTARDTGVVSAMVHNESGANRSVTVSLRAEGLALRGEAERQVNLASGQARRLDWDVEALRDGECRLIASARADGGLNDAMELKLPVLPHGRSRTETRAGALSGDGVVEERVPVRPDAAGGTTVTLTLAPSLASGMLSALQYLAHYPYGCTEQTMSCFLPDLVVHRALNGTRLGRANPGAITRANTEAPGRANTEGSPLLNDPRLAREVPDMVNAGLQRLYRYQHHDGGWGWWEFDDSDVGMTAYVVEGLVQAREAGFAVNPEVLRKGTEWLLARERVWGALAQGISPEQARALVEQAQGNQRQVVAAAVQHYRPGRVEAIPEERAQVLLALARAGERDTVISALSPFPEALQRAENPAVIADLCRAAHLIGRTEEMRALRARLVSLALTDDAFCHWGRDAETTALALQAILAAGGPGSAGRGVPPGSPETLAQKTARWLLAHRDEDHWLSTRGTARVLVALTDYLAASGETAPRYEVVPSLNGHVLSPVHFGSESVFRPETTLTLDPRWLVPVGRGENVLRLAKRGPGSLYYTVRVRQFVGQEDLRVIVGGSGIAVERTYHELRPAKVYVHASYEEPEGMRTRLLPSEKPVQEMRAGESYLGRIVVQVSQDFEHVVIEEPIPAGCEPVDQGRADAEEWGHWWSNLDVRDHQIAFFARRLPKGRHVLEYYVRASLPGQYHVMPTALSGMYDPNLRASGAETRVRVR